jgi:hypothetical protein
MALFSKALVAIGALTLAFLAGTCVIPVDSGPQIGTIIEPGIKCRLVESHVVQYVDEPVILADDSGQSQGLPADLRYFSDLDEMEQWLATAITEVTSVYFQSPGSEVDCDDYALDLQRKALADGYIISFQVVRGSEYNTLFKSKLPSAQTLHAINSAIIGNNVYYIEPQIGEVVFAAYLD